MEVGRLGVHGTRAAKVVEPVNNNAEEAAQSRRLATVEELALEPPEKIKRAARATVQVIT